MMFVRLAVLLLCTVATVVICWRVYIRVVLPELRRRRIQRMEEDNRRYDRYNRS